MSSVRSLQRQEWADHLSAIEFFDDIPILVMDVDDVENEYERALGPLADNGKSGICVVLYSVPAKPDGAQEFGPTINCYHVAHITENVIQNRGSTGTGKTREEVAERIVSATHGVFQPTTARSPFIMDAAGIEPDPEMPAESVSFLCAAVIEANLEQVAAPVITNNNGDVTMTCATPGAAIFYTVNGGRPTPSANLYVDTIALSGLIKARAFLAGHLNSDITQSTI